MILKNIHKCLLSFLIFFLCFSSLKVMGRENQAILNLKSINKEITIYKKKVSDWENQLFAVIDGKLNPLISNAYIDFEIIDINQDGNDELLVSSSDGGNGNPPKLLMYFFKESQSLLIEFIFDGWLAWSGWEEDVIKSKKYSTLLTGVSNYTASPKLLKHTSISYLFDGDSVILYSIINKNELPALMEIRSTNFNEINNGSRIEMIFDLNSDGDNDNISCGFFPRWGDLINCMAYISSIGKIPIRFNSKRLGVLHSRKNGVSMLVLDHDTILAFDLKNKKFGRLYER